MNEKILIRQFEKAISEQNKKRCIALASRINAFPTSGNWLGTDADFDKLILLIQKAGTL